MKNNKSIKIKIISTILIYSCVLIVCIQGYTSYHVFVENNNRLAQIQQILSKDYDKNIRNQVEVAISIIETSEKNLEAQGVALEKRKTITKELIRDARYEKEGYFWIDTYEGINVLFPPKPSIEGKDRNELKDVKGKLLIQEIITKGRKKNGDFTDYWFPKPGKEGAFRKRGYSLAYEKYEWVIGTGNYLDDIEKAVADQKAILSKDFYTSLIITGVVFILAIALALLISIMIGNSLSKPIVYITEFIKILITGDLTQEIPDEYLNLQDEIGIALNAIDKFSKKMNEIIAEINASSIQLSATSEVAASTSTNFSDSSQKQAVSVEEISATIEEISAGIQLVKENSDDQKDSVLSLADAIQRLNVIEKDITDNSETISRFSKIILERSDESNKSLKSMQSEFDDINESSKKMLEMVNLVNGIADQINLLSLNAAIESARAGEAGRGFAVVADQISKLADETSTNVKRIQDNIRTNDEKIKKGNEIVFESLEKLNNVIKGIQDISDTINVISETIKEQTDVSKTVNEETENVKEKSESIYYAIEEQKIAMTEITESIAVINEEIQSNAAGSEEVANSSVEISSMSQVLRDKISFFVLKKH